jgi:hypothetical protein
MPLIKTSKLQGAKATRSSVAAINEIVDIVCSHHYDGDDALTSIEQSLIDYGFVEPGLYGTDDKGCLKIIPFPKIQQAKPAKKMRRAKKCK